MLTPLLMVMVGATIAMSSPHFCPPACNPPADIVGCIAFRRASACKQNVIDKGIGPSACSCKWQEYIVAVGKRGKVMFTDDGEDCFTWAAVTCGLASKISKQKNSVDLEKELAVGIVQSLKNIAADDDLQNINLSVPEEVKIRRRNGVPVMNKSGKPSDTASSTTKADKSKNGKDVEFIGKPHSIGNHLSWIEIEPRRKNTSITVKKAIGVKGRTIWFLPNMQDDEFKLWIFVTIVILNIIVVLFAVACSTSQKSEPKEVRPLGDLDATMYIQAKPKGKEWPLRKVIQKIREIKAQRTEKNSKYTQMNGTKTGHVSTGSQSSRRHSAGIYDFLHDTSDLNNTYEEPVFMSRQHQQQQQQYSMSVEMPTETQPRTVSFSVPSASEEMLAGNRRNNKRPGGGPPILSMAKYLDNR